MKTCRALDTNFGAQHAVLIVRVDAKNGGNIFFRNVGVYLKDNTVSHLYARMCILNNLFL